MNKKALIIPLLFSGVLCSAQNVSVPSTDTIERSLATASQDSLRTELLQTSEATFGSTSENENDASTATTSSTSSQSTRSRRGSRRSSSNGARGRLRVSSTEGITTLDTDARGNASVSAEVNGATVAEEIATNEDATPTVTRITTSNSSSSTTSSRSAANITVSDTEGIVDQNIETTGNSSASIGANGEIVAEEGSNDMNSASTETVTTNNEAVTEDTTSSNGPNRAGARLELRGGEVTNAITAVSGNSDNGSRSASIVSGGETISETTSVGSEETETANSATPVATTNSIEETETPSTSTESTSASTSDTTSSLATGSITVSSTEGIVDQNIETTGNSSASIGANGEIVAEETSSNEETQTPSTSTESTSSNSILPPNVATANVTVSNTGGNEVTSVDSRIENNGAVSINTSTGTTVNQASNGFERLRETLPEVIAFVFPNPARDFVNISTPRTTISKVEITSSRGELVRSETLNGLRRARISISDLQQGLYFINIFSDSGMATKKFFKN